jgi:N-ethylmaleimide reductase
MDLLDHLFEPLQVGDTKVRNRLAMAPLTRQRSYLDGTPTDLNVEYYRQRASAGLLISEGVYPSEMGKGYLFSPGLCNDDHAAGWKKVTDAVHEEDGAIFAQVMHVGRLTDSLMLPGHAQPIGVSAVQPDPTARHYTVTCPRAKRPYPQPRALEAAEVWAAIGEFGECAAYGKKAGFDGVEIHAASGYFPMQFLSTNTNLRTDEFGGSLENRARFLLECVDAMIAKTSPGFVAVKIGPGWVFHNVFDDNPVATYTYVTKELSKRGIAYLQVGDYGMDWDVHATLRPLFEGPYIGVAGFTRTSAAEAIADGRMDMVAFGQLLLANPDLVERFRNGWPLNRPDPATYYTQGEEGYTDYPFYSAGAREDLVDVDSMAAPLPSHR